MPQMTQENLLFEDDDRANFIEEILSLSSSMIEALKEGPSVEAAKKVCSMLLPYTTADAISLTDKNSVLSYVGFLEERYPVNCKLRTKSTIQTIKDGKARRLLTEQDIGFAESNGMINAAIVEPLVVMDEPVGVLKFYFKDPSQMTKTQCMIAKGFARVISTQVQARETERQRELRALMELKMLQSQINPHFLFNTLNTILSLIRTNPEKARETLRDFSSFYRSTLELDSELVPLDQELENTVRYVSIEQARFGEERLMLKVSGDEIPKSLCVPPFLLQPIVENSIRHGMPPSGQLLIEIFIKKLDRAFEIQISDNGKGMEKRILYNLFNQTLRDSGGLGLAMSNVHDRLLGTFGKRARISVESELGVGTKTSIIIPLKAKETPVE